MDVFTYENLNTKTNQEIINLLRELRGNPDAFSDLVDEEICVTQKKLLIQAILQHQSNEATISQTPVCEQLPEIYNNRRIVLNCFSRAALFGLIKKGERKFLRNEVIHSMSQYQITYTGDALDQNDSDLFDALMYLAKDKRIDSILSISTHEICQYLKVTYNKERSDKIFERALRLQSGQIIIHSKNNFFAGSLFNNVAKIDNKLVVEYNKNLIKLFNDDITFINYDTTALIGDNQLARWLYKFFMSHSAPKPFSLANIMQLSGSSNHEINSFKQKLKKSLELVAESHKKSNPKSKWTYLITNKNNLFVFPTGKPAIFDKKFDCY